MLKISVSMVKSIGLMRKEVKVFESPFLEFA